MNTSKPIWSAGRIIAAVGILTVLAACQTRPEVRTQSAPNLDLARYTTYGFMDKPSTDQAGYKTLTTRYLEEAVSREMAARGYQRADSNPDLLINFNVAEKNKVESRGPSFGVGYGSWGWRHGYAWGVGYPGDDIHNYTEGSLTVDLVDRSRNELVWSGTAVGRLSKKVMDKPQPAIEQAVDSIFAKYPKPEMSAQSH